MNLNVNTSNGTYSIEIGKNILSSLNNFYKPSGKVMVITDSKVNALGYPEKLIGSNNYNLLVMDEGEHTKSLESVELISEALLEKNFTRDDTIIALGGGVIGDLVGFVASIYFRGIDFIQIPTTLLSQVDSSVGGKTAVNTKSHKNSIGSFYQPKFVLIDTDTLKTLETRQFNNGMAEVIKYGAIMDKDLFYRLFEDNLNLEQIIYSCLSLKKKVVEEDTKEKGIRKILNYGHTIGHGIESFYNFDKYYHGESIAIGMVMITDDEYLKSEIIKLLQKYNLPTQTNYDKDIVFKVMKNDKKAKKNNSIDIILLKEIGKAYIKTISLNELKNYL